jgi:hypothetical protein
MVKTFYFTHLSRAELAELGKTQHLFLGTRSRRTLLVAHMLPYGSPTPITVRGGDRRDTEWFTGKKKPTKRARRKVKERLEGLERLKRPMTEGDRRRALQVWTSVKKKILHIEEERLVLRDEELAASARLVRAYGAEPVEAFGEKWLPYMKFGKVRYAKSSFFR